MTLFAARAKDAGEPGGDRDVTVGATYGPVTFKITEDAGHLRSFWGQLGRLLEEIEHPAPAAEQPDDDAQQEYADALADTEDGPDAV